MSRIDYALSAAQRADARAALALLDGTDLSLEEAARRAIVGRRSGKRHPFSEAVDIFTRHTIKSGCRPATVDWYGAKLAPFVIMWEQRAIDAITRAEIREAIQSLACGEATKAAHARALRALWRFCAAQEPPLTGADVTHGLDTTGPRHTTQNSGRDAFLSVPDVEKVLNQIPEIYRDALATMLFGGVRPGEMHEKQKPGLLYRHVNPVEKFIRVPDEVAKSGKARLIQGLPSTLWFWLSKPKPGALDRSARRVCPVQAIQIRKWAAFILDRELPYDCFRHTFATYGVSLLGEGATVAMWLGHEGNTTLLFNTYAGCALKTEAVKFWALRPTACAPLPIRSATRYAA